MIANPAGILRKFQLFIINVLAFDYTYAQDISLGRRNVMFSGASITVGPLRRFNIVEHDTLFS